MAGPSLREACLSNSTSIILSTTSSNDLPSPLVRVPFLALRLAFTALAAAVSSISIIFAVFAVYLTQQVAKPASLNSAILVIIGDCFILSGCLAIWIDVITQNVTMARVDVECAGVGVATLFKIPVTINATVKGPPQFCFEIGMSSLCAASMLLVHVAWFSSMLCLAYFLLLLLAAVCHRGIYPNIWDQRVLDVDWFMASRARSILHRQSFGSLASAGSCRGQLDSSRFGTSDFAMGEGKLEMQEQPWPPRIRRGYDHPFGDGRYQLATTSALYLPLTSPRHRVRFVEPVPLTPMASFQESEQGLKPPVIPALRFSDCICSRGGRL